VWCLAADPAGNHLAAACDDGLRLFDISNGDIMFKKAFTKAGSGTVSPLATPNALC
jgi:CelD/BcsL family acetyltransferase involved in cellulose biosynthesis